MKILYQNRTWDVVKVSGADSLDETMAAVAVRMALASHEQLVSFSISDLRVAVREA